MALRDPVTQLPSEALFMDRLGQALALARRKRTRIAVVHLELEGAALDEQGLSAMARRLETVLRTSDTISRLPGHDFSVLLNDVDSVAAARAVAEELVLAAGRPLGDLQLTAAYGLAVSPQDGEDEAQLLAAAAANLGQVPASA